MSKYGPLKSYLQSQVAVEIPMTFAEIEEILGKKLPASAYRHRPWWANEPSGHVHAQAWLEAGFASAKVDLAAQTLVFRRLVSPPAPTAKPGLSDEGRGFAGVQDGAEEMTTDCKHPAYGWMKGMFTIAPGTDLTAPMYTDEEWAEVEKEMEADWDEIERGMAGK